MRERNANTKKSKDDSLDTLVTDLIKVYVLDSLTMTMSYVCSQQGDIASRILTGATIACFQFLGKDDNIVKQAIKYIERIVNIAKRIPAV